MLGAFIVDAVGVENAGTGMGLADVCFGIALLLPANLYGELLQVCFLPTPRKKGICNKLRIFIMLCYYLFYLSSIFRFPEGDHGYICMGSLPEWGRLCYIGHHNTNRMHIQSLQTLV